MPSDAAKWNVTRWVAGAFPPALSPATGRFRDHGLTGGGFGLLQGQLLFLEVTAGSKALGDLRLQPRLVPRRLLAASLEGLLQSLHL